MERDIIAVLFVGLIIISTHTLTWSVTRDDVRTALDGRISTHTLTWSVTELRPLRLLTHQISTHTLTWSVTNSILTIYKITVHFNSHAHVERDSSPSEIVLIYSSYFNSHAHVERDETEVKDSQSHKNFNSHAHVERDICT